MNNPSHTLRDVHNFLTALFQFDKTFLLGIYFLPADSADEVVCLNEIKVCMLALDTNTKCLGKDCLIISALHWLKYAHLK